MIHIHEHTHTHTYTHIHTHAHILLVVVVVVVAAVKVVVIAVVIVRVVAVSYGSAINGNSRTFLPNIISPLEPLSDSDIKKLLMWPSNDFCELDTMPAWLIKQCQIEQVTVTRNTVHVSLKTWVFTQSMKAALLKPLIS